jgi:transposase
MISAITSGGKLRFHFYSGKMTQEKFKEFLKYIMKKTDKKVFAISDNLGAHIALDLKAWAGANADKIELFNLPRYAPHLNPAEYLNNNLKYEISRKGYAKDKKEIKKNAMNIMRSIARKKNRVASFFDHEDVKYAKFDPD